MSTKGFDDLSKQLKQIEKDVKKLGKKKNVPMKEIFTPSFMRKYTKSSSIDIFFTSDGLNIQTEEDLKNFPDADMDAHVKEHTKFNSWQEMLNKAGQEYFEKELKKIF